MSKLSIKIFLLNPSKFSIIPPPLPPPIRNKLIKIFILYYYFFERDFCLKNKKNPICLKTHPIIQRHPTTTLVSYRRSAAAALRAPSIRTGGRIKIAARIIRRIFHFDLKFLHFFFASLDTIKYRNLSYFFINV